MIIQCETELKIGKRYDTGLTSDHNRDYYEVVFVVLRRATLAELEQQCRDYGVKLHKSPSPYIYEVSTD